MVNHGPSRACETCKKRRKKCDEARPYCLRCAKSGRLCMGYQSDDGVQFRHYRPVEPLASPEQAFDAEDRILQQESCPLSQEDLVAEKNALQIFYDDYQIRSKDLAVSRGFLHGIDLLIENAGHGSDVARAAELVAMAGYANRVKRAGLAYKTEEAYCSVLQSYQASLSNLEETNEIEILMTAVFLGYYEIITSCEAYPNQHFPHVNGVGAIIHMKRAPFHLLSAIQLTQLGNPVGLASPINHMRIPGLSCAPILHKSVKSLDRLISVSNPVWRVAQELLSQQNPDKGEVAWLESEAVALCPDFAAWEASQSGTWTPTVAGSLNSDQAALSEDHHFWPGEIHVFFDLHIAAVWNTFRKMYVFVLNTIVRCRMLLNAEAQSKEEEDEANRLSRDMLASVPFHLIRDFDQSFVEQVDKLKHSSMGPPVGGLLLLHPLYVLRRAQIVSPDMREYIAGRLVWIAQKMGISQAALLADPNSSAPFNTMAQGHVLIWAGMLLNTS